MRTSIFVDLRQRRTDPARVTVTTAGTRGPRRGEPRMKPRVEISRTSTTATRSLTRRSTDSLTSTLQSTSCSLAGFNNVIDEAFITGFGRTLNEVLLYRPHTALCCKESRVRWHYRYRRQMSLATVEASHSRSAQVNFFRLRESVFSFTVQQGFS